MTLQILKTAYNKWDKSTTMVWSRFDLKTNFDLFYFSLGYTTKTWAEYKIHWKILK